MKSAANRIDKAVRVDRQTDEDQEHGPAGYFRIDSMTFIKLEWKPIHQFLVFGRATPSMYAVLSSIEEIAASEEKLASSEYALGNV